MAGYRRNFEKEPEIIPPEGKVSEVKSQWRVHEDGVLAHKLQEEEFGAKYDWNKKDRKTARKDVPLAKVVQTEEEERLQRERMLQLEELRLQSSKDAMVAQQLYQEELQHANSIRSRAEADAAVARQAHEEEMQQARVTRLSSADFDAAMAERYREDDDHERRMRELKDQELAVQLQERERRKYEIRKQQKSLAKQRKDIEYMQHMETERILGQDAQVRGQDDDASAQNIGILEAAMENVNIGGQRNKKVLRPDGKLEDDGDFSDFYIQPSGQMAPAEKRELQELQDEELARLLQDQEHKRGAKVDRDRLKQIEERDAELARVMMEQEKLKVLKRKEAKQRQLHQRQVSEPGGPTQPPQGIAHARGGSLPATHPVYDEQNSVNERIKVGGETVPPMRENYDGSSGGIRALGRQYPPNKTNGQAQNRTVDRDPHYQSHYGQRPLPATPDNEMQRGRTPYQNGRQSGEGNYQTNNHGPSNDIPQSHRPVRSPSPPEEVAPGPPVSTNNVIASIDPTFKGERDTEPPTQHKPAPLVGQSPPQTINRLPPTVTSGGEDGYCDLDDMQNFTPVQGQKRNSNKRDSKRSSKKDKNCKQQ